MKLCRDTALQMRARWPGGKEIWRIPGWWNARPLAFAYCRVPNFYNGISYFFAIFAKKEKMNDLTRYIRESLLDKFEFQNYGHALEILNEAFPTEWNEIQNCLTN